MKRDKSGTSRPPNGELSAVPRTIDLYGLAPDGGPPLLWKHAMPVMPIDVFERNGRWIRTGYYVIDYMGDAIAVHCGNQYDEDVNVQFVVGEPTAFSVPRAMIETMLLGRVMISAEQQAAILDGKRLNDFFMRGEPLFCSRTASNEEIARRKQKPAD
jgi:hypothetical protein